MLWSKQSLSKSVHPAANTLAREQPATPHDTTPHDTTAQRLTWLQVVVDDGGPDLVQVLERVDHLHDDRAALLLRHEFVLLQVEVQVVPLAELQNRAEPARRHNKQSTGQEQPVKPMTKGIL